MATHVHMKTLWAILSGTNKPICPEKVGPYIESAQKFLIDGLQSFRPRANSVSAPDTAPGTAFNQYFSQITHLEEAQVSRLLEVYRENEFRGTAEQFDGLKGNSQLRQGLSAELWQFHHNERAYLLHCVEHLVQHSQNTNHSYSDIFCGFMDTYNSRDELRESLIHQLRDLNEAKPPQGPSANLVKSWLAANLRERLLLLQCLIRYDENHIRAEDFVALLSSVNLTVPGDAELEGLHYSILHLHSALLVKLMQVTSAQRFRELLPHSKAIEEQFEKLSVVPEYSPVLLSWMLVHYTHSEGTARAQAFGEKAVSQRVLKIVADIANDPLIQGESSLRDIVCSSIHELVRLLVDSFDTERLSTPVDLRSAAAALLRSNKTSDTFWAMADQGLHLVWRECTAQFPAEFMSLLELAKSVAQNSTISKIKVVEELSQLPYYVEPVEGIPESNLKWTSDGVVILLQTHFPYRSTRLKDVVIPRGTAGQLEGKNIRWEVKTSLFDVAVGDIQLLLEQASFGLSAIKLDTLVRVQKMLDFLELVFVELDEFEPAQSQRIQHLILQLIERFGGLSSTTSELLANCFRCLAASIKPSNASEVAAKMLTFGSILPSLDRPIPANLEELSQVRILPGVVGTALAGIECPAGSYPLTGALLKLITSFIQAELTEARLLIPSTLFILREVFPYLLSWPYVNLESRDEMIHLCLDFLHRVLQTANGNAVKSLCIRSLVDSEAEFLITIASYGPSLAEMQLLKQTNWEDSQSGRGLILLRQIRTALSILNQLLDGHVKPGLSKLESILSAQRFVTILASYIFHRFDLRLATLSLKVLRSCASRWANVSLLACLGQDAPLIRQAWLSCLESPLEDVGLIQSILRLMTDSIANQPGLMHMLVNGEGRCLNAVALLLESNQLEALRLVNQFWSQSCCPAVEFFKKRAGFWNTLSKPLFESEDAERAALIFQMMAAELYNTSGQVDAELQTVLDKLPNGYLSSWSDLVLKGDDIQLISGWSAFVTTSAHYSPARTSGLRSTIRKDVLEALTTRVEAGNQDGKVLDKLAVLHWMLQLTEKNTGEDVVASFGRLLIAVAERGLTSFQPRFQAAILTCAVSTIRLTKTSPISGKLHSLLSQWMHPAAICSQSCLVQLPGLKLASAENGLPSSKASCITSLCLSLLAELIPLVLPQELGALRETYLLQTLVSSIQFFLHHRSAPDVTETILAVLLAVAGTESGSSVLTSLQLDHSLWLPLEVVYSIQPGVYRLGVQLCSVMLFRQRHFFLEEALTFVGVHRSPLSDALLKLGNPANLSVDELALAVDVMALLGTISKFQATWRLQQSGSCMQGVLQAATAAVYFAIAHLIRSKLGANPPEETSPAQVETQTLLLDLISQGLALLNCYSPPLGALLTEDGIDVAKWDRHLSPSFGNPSLEHNANTELGTCSFPSLSFGTLNAAGSHCLRLLSRPDVPQQQQLDQSQRNRLNLVLELSLSLLISQALLYILDPNFNAQEKQHLKREVGAELSTFVESLRRQAQRGLRSPAGGSSGLAVMRQTSVSPVGDQGFLKLVGHIVQHLFK